MNKANGRYEISSQAFQPSGSDGGLSGDLEQLLTDDNLAATTLYPAVRHAVGAASLLISQITIQGATVHHDPVDDNWYHGAVRGIKRAMRKEWEKNAIEAIEINQAEAKKRDEDAKRRALEKVPSNLASF